MGTANYPCGCSITRSMFGDNGIMSIHICFEHAFKFQSHMQMLAEDIQNEYKVNKNVAI